MTKRLLLVFGLFISLITVHGQKLQLGLSASINSTFFHKGQSFYDNYFFKTRTKTCIGLSVPTYLKFTDNWSFKTGIGFQNKKYHFEQNKYDFPNVIDGSGSYYFEMKFTAIEVPLLICYFQNFDNKKFSIEYKLGCVFSYNIPTAQTLGYSTFKYNGNDVCFTKINVNENWAKTYSPDIYIAISILKTKESLRKHELTLSYQYGFLKTTQYEFSSMLSNSTLTKEYHAILKPYLSYIALTYEFFPKWLNIIKDSQPK